MTTRKATILQLVSAPGHIADDFGNLYVGYALVEFEIDSNDGGRHTIRDIFPFDSRGACVNCLTAPSRSRTG